MNFGQMQVEVRRRLNETSSVFWTDQDIKDALNEGLAEIADATEYYERQATLQLLASRTYYDLSSLLPDTFLSPRRIYNTTNNRWMTPSSPQELDEQRGQWEIAQGTADWYWLRGNWWLGAYPKSAVQMRGLRILYSSIPPPMTEDEDEPDFPREFHPGLVKYALFDCHAQQRETKKALKYWAEYQAIEEDLAAYVDKRLTMDRKDTF